jgi:tetratricopeptide (TPR) repeat protein
MKKGTAVDVARLESDVVWALEQGLGARDLVPMLERLRRHAAPGSGAACFACIELAEQLLPTRPWRAAVLAREVLRHVETDRAWAVQGLALAILGHYASAKASFARALHLAPNCASYAHNLGHLIDVGLGRPRDALVWLERAHMLETRDPEIASSYAHALLGVGRVNAARRLLLEAGTLKQEEVESTLTRWAAMAPLVRRSD